MSSVTNVYMSDGDLPTLTSSKWATVLSKVGSYTLYFFNHLIYSCLLLPPKDYKHYLTYVTPTDVTYVTPTDVSTTFKIMLINPWSCTLTLEMQILLGK